MSLIKQSLNQDWAASRDGKALKERNYTNMQETIQQQPKNIQLPILDNNMIQNKFRKRQYILGIIFFIFIILIIYSSIKIFSAPKNVAHQLQNQATQSNPSIKITVNLTNPIGISHFHTGASHTQKEIALGNNQSEISSARKLISSALSYENIPIMGWGSPDPEPTPGHYNWNTLDKRIQFIESTGTTPMITLCCAPGWMRSPSQANDFKYLAARPTNAHFQDFANLAKQVALRYPQVRYYQVWNELKGFYNKSLNRWDYEDYTTLYNMVYDAIKAVRPDAQIGGPYVVMVHWSNAKAGGHPAHDPSLVNQSFGTVDQRSLDVLSYWLAHKHGADFIAIDGGLKTKDSNVSTDPFVQAQYFSSIMKWIRTQPDGGATLPVGWAEWYPSFTNDQSNINYDNAVMANALIETIKSGYFYALLWGTQGNSQGLNAFPASFMTNTATPTIEYDTLKAIKDYFGNGTQLYDTSSTSSTITVLASKTKTMLVNHLNKEQTISINGTVVTLSPYQVAIITTPI